MTVGVVWAQSRGGVIGAEGALPWDLPEDLARFRVLTLGSTVVMGRLTWQSLPAGVRPLPGRRNVVLTRTPGFGAEGAEVAHSLPEALALATGDVWVIGGGAVLAEALPYAQRAVVTEVDLDVAGDTWAPALDAGWRLAARDPGLGWHLSAAGLGYRVTSYRRDTA